MGTGKAEMIFSIVEREVINFMKSLSTVARFSLVKTGIRTRFLRMYFIFIVILMYLLEPTSIKGNFHFYALHIDE